MKEKTKQKLLEIAQSVFITGETYMVVVWGAFISGLIIGGVLF